MEPTSREQRVFDAFGGRDKLLARSATGIAAALGLLLLFPPLWMVAVPAAALLATGIALAWLARSRRLAGLATGLAVLGATWAVVGPFAILPKPLYFHIDLDWYPRRTTRGELGGDVPHGTLLTLHDPLRAGCAVALSHWTSAIRELCTVEIGGSRLVVLPLAHAHRQRVGANSIDNESNELLLYGYGPSVELREVPDGGPGKLRLVVSARFDASAIVEFEGPPAMRWDVVHVGPGSLEKTLQFAAMLDGALNFIAEGSPTIGVSWLHDCFESSPSRIESARVACLIAVWAAGHVTGNIGSAQAAGYYHRAAEAVEGVPLVGTTDAAISRWVARELQTAEVGAQSEPLFFLFPPAGNASLQDWVSVAESMLGRNERLSVSFKARQKQLERIATEQFIVEARTAAMAGPNAARLFIDLGFERLALALRGASELGAVAQALLEVAQACHEPWRSIYRYKVGSVVRLRRLIDKPTGADAHEWAEEEARDLEAVLRDRGITEHSWLARGLVALASPVPETVMGIPSTADPAAPWWDFRFLDATCVRLLQFTARREAEPDHRIDLPAAEIRRLIRDRGGRGRLFAPSVVFLLSLRTGMEAIPRADLEAMLEESTGRHPSELVP